MLRQPAVAGRFYKGTSESLGKQVQEFIIPVADRKKAIGILSPHAGLMYSGSVAGAVYSNIELPETIVLIGPNHTGLGPPVSVMAQGSWETPLGTVPIDEPLASSILAGSPRMSEDSLAHMREHSLEVQLPFIQYLKNDFKIVPIQMLDIKLDTCLEVGRAVGEAIAECKSAICNPQSAIRGVLIVASSDMSHYERAASAKEKDFKAIDRILALDPEGLHRTVNNNGITMCGYGPTVAMLAACKLLGATKAELIKYTNSGEVNHDYEQVVGYAGIVIV
jgi:AmmeMemoRadiSam system protein B